MESDWTNVVGVGRSDSGSAGVFFVTHGDGRRCVLKGTTRLLQEHVATLLLRRLSSSLGGVLAPNSRIAQYGKGEEWSRIPDALLRVAGHDTPDGTALKKQLNRAFYFVMEFVPDARDLSAWLLSNCARADGSARAPIDANVLAQLGGLMAFDVLVNNSDRLPLIWSNEGNLGNILLTPAADGAWTVHGIDQATSTMDVKSPNGAKAFEAYSRRVRSLVSNMRASVEARGPPCKEIVAVGNAIGTWSVGAVVPTDGELIALQRALARGLLALAECAELDRDAALIVDEAKKCVTVDWERVWADMCKLVHADFFVSVLGLLRENAEALRVCANDPRCGNDCAAQLESNTPSVTCARDNRAVEDSPSSTPAKAPSTVSIAPPLRSLVVLAVQRSSIPLSRAAQAVEDALDGHAAGGGGRVDIVVFPECFISDAVHVTASSDIVAVLRADPRIAAVSDVLAKRDVACLLGTFDEVHESPRRVFCTAPMFDADGTLLGVYRKRYPTCGGTSVSPGDELGRVFVSARLGRIGVAICYDVEHDDVMEALVAQKPAVILNPIAILKPSTSNSLANAQSARRTALSTVARNTEWRMMAARCTLVRCDNPAAAGYLGSTVAIGPVHTLYAPSANVCMLAAECADFDDFPKCTRPPERERTERRDNSGNHVVCATLIQDSGAAVTSLGVEGRVTLVVTTARGRVYRCNVVTMTQEKADTAVPVDVVALSAAAGDPGVTVSGRVHVGRSAEDSRIAVITVDDERMRLRAHAAALTAVAVGSAWIATGDADGRVLVWTLEQNRVAMSPSALWPEV